MRAPGCTRSFPRAVATRMYAGTGPHVLARDQLERYREAVADDRSGPALAAAVAAAVDAGPEPAGESLKTAPRGYPRDHPRIGCCGAGP